MNFVENVGRAQGLPHETISAGCSRWLLMFGSGDHDDGRRVIDATPELPEQRGTIVRPETGNDYIGRHHVEVLERVVGTRGLVDAQFMCAKAFRIHGTRTWAVQHEQNCAAHEEPG